MVGSIDAVMELGLLLIVLMMLACPLVMGAMLLMMWRGMRHRDGAAPQNDRER